MRFHRYDRLRIGQPWFAFVVLLRAICNIVVLVGVLVSLYGAVKMTYFTMPLPSQEISLYWTIMVSTALAVLIDSLVLRLFFQWQSAWRLED